MMKVAVHMPSYLAMQLHLEMRSLCFLFGDDKTKRGYFALATSNVVIAKKFALFACGIWI